MKNIWPNKPIRIYNIEKLLGSIKQDDWVVQQKLNGKRVLVVGEDNVMLPIKLYGRQWQRFSETCDKLIGISLPRPFLLDGELMRNGDIYLWDLGMLDGAYQYSVPYIERFNKLQEIQHTFPKNVKLVQSLPASQYHQLLNGRDKDLEGLVFKNKQAQDMWSPTGTREVAGQFKYRF